MATIRKRTDGKKTTWQVLIRRKGYPTESRTFDSRGAAETWASTIESKMHRGIYETLGEAERTSLDEALKRYGKEVTPSKKGAEQEARRIKQLREMAISEYSLAALRSSDIAEWRNELVDAGKAPTTVRNLATIISQTYERARIEWGMEGLRNPVRGVPMPKHRKGRDRRLVGDEEKRLLEACENLNGKRVHWVAPIVRLALETGMRLGEILSIKWDYIDLKHSVLRLPDTKNNEHRDVPLSTAAVKIFEGLTRNLDGQVFPMTVHIFEGHFKRAREAAEIEDLRFHDLRHEATSRLFEKGLDIMEVAAITGHKTLNMLKRYTHLRARDLAKKLG